MANYTQQRQEANSRYNQRRLDATKSWNEQIQKTKQREQENQKEWEKVKSSIETDLQKEYETQFGKKKEEINKEWQAINQKKHEELFGARKGDLTKQQRKAEKLVQAGLQRGNKGKRIVKATPIIFNKKIKKLTDKISDEINEYTKGDEYKNWAKTTWDKEIQPDINLLETEAKPLYDQYGNKLKSSYEQSAYYQDLRDIAQYETNKAHDIAQIEQDYQRELEAIRQQENNYNPMERLRNTTTGKNSRIQIRLYSKQMGNRQCNKDLPKRSKKQTNNS